MNDLQDSPAWDYVDGFDTPQSYEAFEYYRDSTPRLRSIVSTAMACNLSTGTVYRWSEQYLWRERVASYDAFRIRQREALRATREQEIDEKWADKRARLLEQLHEVTTAGLVQIMNDLQKRRSRLRPNELKQLLDLELKYGNLANGDATERVEVPIDLSNASAAELEALEAARGLLGKK